MPTFGPIQDLWPPNLRPMSVNLHRKENSLSCHSNNIIFLKSNLWNKDAFAYAHACATDIETAGGWHQGSFLLVAQQGQRSCLNSLTKERAKPAHVQPTLKTAISKEAVLGCSSCKYARHLHASTYWIHTHKDFFAWGVQWVCPKGCM